MLYDVPVKAGSTVALRDGDVSKQMKVLAIDGKVAHCLSLPEKEPVDQPLDSLVSVAKFGEPIYPYLKQLDTVCNAPDSDLWHTLIEADNYHPQYGYVVDVLEPHMPRYDDNLPKA